MRSRFRWLGAVLFLASALAPIASSQDAGDDPAMVAKKKAKLEAGFFKKATWLTDYSAARAEAAKSGKPIFAYFTRSYAR